MITWVTHATAPGSLATPDLAARRDIRARRAESNERFRLLGRPQRIGRFVRFERAHSWGLQAIFEMQGAANG